MSSGNTRKPAETLPHDVEAECAALACVLDGGPRDEAAKYFSQLQERHFHCDHTRDIYRALTKVEADGTQFDAVELRERLLADGTLKRVGGEATIAALNVPHAANFPSYLAILEDRAARREKIKAAEQDIRDARDIGRPVQSAPAKLSDRLASRIYSPQAKPNEPTPRFSLAGVPICTPGNLTVVAGPPKSAKSAATGAMMASTFAVSGSDCLGFESSNPQGHALVHIDTEQCPFDHWDGIQRIARRAGTDAPAWLRSYCLTGFSAADVRHSFQLLTEQAAKDCGGVHCVIVDGIADAAQDVNDPAESNDLVTELHALAIKFDCPVVNIIHVNPGSDFKTRGHLGSQLERKSETNLRLEKDGDGVTVIYADKNRRAPIPKTTGPRFAWNDKTGMHVSIASQKNAKADVEKQSMQTEAEAIFTAAGKAAVSYGKFIELLMSEVHASKSTAKRRFNDMLRTQIIHKELLGFYALTQK